MTDIYKWFKVTVLYLKGNSYYIQNVGNSSFFFGLRVNFLKLFSRHVHGFSILYLMAAVSHPNEIWQHQFLIEMIFMSYNEILKSYSCLVCYQLH